MKKALIDIKDFEYLVGMPYKKKCFDGTGFDCWSLINHVYKKEGISLPLNLLDSWTGRTIHKAMQKQKKLFYPVPFEDRKRLDVLLFHTSYALMTHVGLVINKQRFIHAHNKMNVVIERFSSGVFSSLIHKVYRWHNI